MNKLPNHLKRWVATDVQAQLDFEPQLDCGACSRFLGKCCAFQPFIPNFLATFRTPSRNYFCAPIGLLATKDYQSRYFATPMKERGRDLFCLNYSAGDGRCLIWEDRPAECASFFCESARGEMGLTKWRGLSEEWNQIEANVAQKAMWERGFEWSVISEQVDWIHNPPETIDLEKAWGAWRGREVEFYDLCRRWADALRTPESASF